MRLVQRNRPSGPFQPGLVATTKTLNQLRTRPRQKRLRRATGETQPILALVLLYFLPIQQRREVGLQGIRGSVQQAARGVHGLLPVSLGAGEDPARLRDVLSICPASREITRTAPPLPSRPRHSPAPARGIHPPPPAPPPPRAPRVPPPPATGRGGPRRSACRCPGSGLR
ncbi:hypothetical protein G6F57_020070 [Rhizopus arrhizus]|nr:hypothetical protein G6F57_020070 [Rhizopus arrhizus]